MSLAEIMASIAAAGVFTFLGSLIASRYKRTTDKERLGVEAFEKLAAKQEAYYTTLQARIDAERVYFTEKMAHYETALLAAEERARKCEEEHLKTQLKLAELEREVTVIQKNGNGH